jgi:aminoglycoside phosphotransferase (APT) family kinase protein
MKTDIILSNVCKGIPNRESFVTLEPIHQGVSGDEKYRVETADGQRFLLRISGIESYERKKTMYDMMARTASLGVSMSRPVDFGICNGGKNVYQLLSWCEGVTADELLPTLSEPEQYALGIKAGRNLRLIHTIQAPEGTKDWYGRFLRVNDKRLGAFIHCGVPIDGSDAILAYYQENRHLLRGRPQCFLHGDYHTGNLLVSEGRELAVVDWDLLDSLYGDPWSEFNRISMGTNFIPHFASGLLHGYFHGEPPEEFWKIFALYLSTGALLLVSWAVYVEPGCLEECKQIASNVVRWFDGMRNIVPVWYLKNFPADSL